MPNKEYRYSSWEAENNEKISGYAVVFESRAVMYSEPETGTEYAEMIDSHALDCTDLSDVVLRFNHEGRVLARTRNNSLKLSVDSHGLRIEADMSKSDEAKSLYKDVKNGLVDKMSFAFIVAPNGDTYDAATHTRRITNIDKILDVSLVDFPAYDCTEVHARARQYLEPEIRALHTAQVKEIRHRVEQVLTNVGIENRSVSDYEEDAELTERELILKKMLEKRAELREQGSSDDVKYAEERFNSIQSLENQLLELAKRKQEERKKIASGEYVRIVAKLENEIGEKNMNEDMRTKFYNELIEKRSAAAVSGMGNVIPTQILGEHVREGSNGMFDHISYTNVAHSGDFKVPYIADTTLTVGSHTENNSITPDGTVPPAVTISHAEYQCTQGYSYLGKALAVPQFEQIINNGLIAAMRLKLDAVAVAAVKGLTWVKTSGATQNAVQWASSGAPKLSEILTLMKLLPERYAKDAKLFMNRATQLSIIEASTGVINTTGSTNSMYNVDIVSGLITLFGVPVIIDSNMSNGDILYGNGAACHLNVAGDMVLNNWLDHDSLTEKMQIACAAGAGTEVGSFVLGANSIS